MENIDVLIYSSPKTAGNTLQQNLINSGYNLYYTHDCNCFNGQFPGQNNSLPLKEYIEKESENKKLTIIMIYREYLERVTSLFFQSFKYLYNDPNMNINDVETNDLITYFNDNVLTNYINYNDYNFNINDGFFELFPEEINNFRENYNEDERYSVWTKGNIQFVVLNFRNIKNWESNLSQIFGKEIKMSRNANFTNEKFYFNKYKDFKSKYVLPRKLYSKIYEEYGYPTLFSYLLTESEKIDFLNKHKIYKTLIGKNGYLFLQNDSGKELQIHNENLCNIGVNSLRRYDNYKNKFLLTIFPNKSMMYKDFLPDGFDMKYRPAFDIYNDYFNGNIIDGFNVLKNIDDTFYKTDTHINLNGAYNIYCSFIDKIKDVLNITIEHKNIVIHKKTVASLNVLELGLGDLTWNLNLGNQRLDCTEDTYYYSNDFTEIYLKYKLSVNDSLRLLYIENNSIVDKTNDYIDTTINWEMLSKHILYKKNSGKLAHKCIIFYDSFLLSTLGIYLDLFEEVYLSKSVFTKEVIAVINPDYIFEFRVERFLF